MTTEELWKAGRLDEAIAAQTAEVKASPSDAERRYLLFALLCFSGNLERADRQLDALGVQDPKLEAGTAIYRNLLASEAERRRVFEDGALPLLPPDAPGWTSLRLEAIRNQKAGVDFATILAQANETEEASAGRCADVAFQAIEDLDEFLGPVLEIFAGGRYLWMPFSLIRRLEIVPPAHLLDLLWIRAQITDATDTVADVHLPALYAGSERSTHDALRLGRATEWEDADGAFRGRGQKLFQLAPTDGTDAIDQPILAIRSLEFDATSES
jgi:type VI secretion system protein ImpE